MRCAADVGCGFFFWTEFLLGFSVFFFLYILNHLLDEDVRTWFRDYFVN